MTKNVFLVAKPNSYFGRYFQRFSETNARLTSRVETKIFFILHILLGRHKNCTMSSYKAGHLSQNCVSKNLWSLSKGNHGNRKCVILQGLVNSLSLSRKKGELVPLCRRLFAPLVKFFNHQHGHCGGM